MPHHAAVGVRVSIGLIAIVVLCGAAPSSGAQELPADTVLHVRLQGLVSSFGSKRDDRITATVIAPATVDGAVRIPLGASVFGHVEAVRRVGLGLSRETAFVEMSFDTLRLPDGAHGVDVAIAARVSALDNARESVDANGRIHGIRATNSFAAMLSGFAVSVGAFDPMLLGYTVSSSLSVFRIPESEVILPPGAELRIRLTSPVALSNTFGDVAPPATRSEEQKTAIDAIVRDLPFRTATADTKQPSDITNLVILGSRQAVAAAFDAAGWGITDPLSSKSTYATLRAIVENQGYREAPMSTLLLDGRAPAFTYAKTLNTFFQRHHLRVFGGFPAYDNVPVWTASSTHDSGIGFATRSKAFIHVIDQDIDEERGKVVFDLVLTGCVDGVSFIDRPWVPRDASNATGDALITDGRAALIRLNACESPRRADATAVDAPQVRPKPGRGTRIARDTTLWFKNDFFRGNIVYQGYSGTRTAVTALGRKKTPVTERSIAYGGEHFRIVPGAEAHKHELAPSDPDRRRRPSFHPVGQRRSTPVSTLEFSASAGLSNFAGDAFSIQFFSLASIASSEEVAISRFTSDPGFNVRTTLNTGRRLSHEFGFTYSRTSFDPAFSVVETPSATAQSPADIRQFNYNFLVNIRPNGSRVRPYVAIGPGAQLIRLRSSSETQNRLLRIAVRDVSLFAGAWDFGSRPPLEGGGIFQLALQYGGGVKMFATPRLFFRMDYRETLSEAPDFWTDSYPTIRSEGFIPGRQVLNGPLRHRLWSAGAGIAF